MEKCDMIKNETVVIKNVILLSSLITQHVILHGVRFHVFKVL